MPYDLGVEATNQIFCAVSHAALKALVNQWKTRDVARYLAQSQASRLLSNGSVQEGDKEARIRRCNAAGDVADVRGGNRATKSCQGMVNRLEDSDVMPEKVTSDCPTERGRKVKKNLRDSMLSLGLEKWLKASAQEAPQVTTDGAIQHQGTAEKALTRARESEVAVDTGRTGDLGQRSLRMAT